MKLTSVEIIPYSFPFSTPFIVSRKTYSRRTGLFIELKSGSISAIGEISPLEEFGTEDIAVATAQSRLIRDELLKEGCVDTIDGIHDLFASYSSFPATVSGFEQALLSLLSKCSGISLYEFFGRKKRDRIGVNGVLGLMAENEIEPAIDSLILKGFSTIKLKIGREQIDDDIQIVKHVVEKYNGKALFRLDANGYYSVPSAQHLLKSLSGLRIEYIEQPVEDIKDFVALREITDIPIAVDESLRSHEDAEYIVKNHLAQVFIIKPAVVGSLFEVIRLIDIADNSGIKGIVTTALDTGIGKRKAVFSASLLNRNVVCGLTIQNSMQKDFYIDSFPVQNGVIHIDGFTI